MLRWITAALALAGLSSLVLWAAWPESRVDAPAAEVQAAAESQAAADPVIAAPPPLQTTAVEIRRRDTVVAALRRHQVSARDAHAIASALHEAGADLRKIKPGDELQLARDEGSALRKVAYVASPWLRFEAAAEDSTWTVARVETQPDVRVEVRTGEVRRSLWDAVESGAVTPQLILDLVQMFESEFDFTADTRPGDRFRLLVEARYAQGKRVDHGRVLAAQYVSGGTTLTGVGFASGEHFAYYDPDGRSLKKMFLRSPLQFTRISSGFTYARPHPILGGVRPHLAIDYAAPTGTPVWAVANGKVVFAGRNGGNGIQVVLSHRAGYKTYYNHLSRIAKGVLPGKSVDQKQVIGYVGSTGLSTGPHLDYRVSKNGTFVNPLQEKFLPGEPIPAAQRAQFAERARELIDRLEQEAPLPSEQQRAGIDRFAQAGGGTLH